MSIFGPLETLRARPIPDQEALRAARSGYRTYPIDKTHAHYHEPLVALADFGVAGENFYFSPRNPPYWQRVEGAIAALVARRSVAERLAHVNARLQPAGLSLFVHDAWRPTAVQAFFHDVWMPREIRRRNPAVEGPALTAEVERYWAAPTENPDAPAPHATGAACDLTLRWTDGALLWMGSIFDDVTALAHRDRLEESTAAFSFSEEEARTNRRLLHWVMTEQGFVGHPDEWWHFSWGDQTWAKLSDAPVAYFGFIAYQGL